MFGIGTSELIVIAIIILLLFGAKSIPEIAKSIAQGIRVFKKEIDPKLDSKQDKQDKQDDQDKK